MRPHRPSLLARTVTIALAITLAAAACSSDDGDNKASGATTDTNKLEITAASTRADSVSGGDVLIAVKGASSEKVAVTVDGKKSDVTFRTSDGGPTKGAQLGLVTGLPAEKATIKVAAGERSGELKVSNHSIQGPIFSGTQLPVTACTTTDFGLDEATPPLCEAPAKVTYQYVDTTGTYQDLPDPAAIPADAKTVDRDGKKFPFVVRTERGVINRGVYEISILDPNPTTTADTPDSGAWNGRLVYRFGGGCGTLYTQGANLLGPPDVNELELGYATATSTFDTFQVHCNDVVSAETALMVKEHFAETYGPPVLTIGEGGSGGAIQQLLIAQNYPGILDALGTTLPFPDAITISGGVVDCALLNTFYRSPAAATWTPEQKVAVNGHLTAQTCDFWESTFVPGIDPSTCGFSGVASGAASALPGLSKGLPAVDQSLVYNAETNPTGIRCTLQDSGVNVFGKDPATGFARRAWDNVGLQYGLKAMQDGTISVDQFLDLNEKVGSFDIDGKPQAERARADSSATEAAYRTGRVNEGGGDLRKIPVIAVNVYTDPKGDIHDRFRAFVVRERLADDKGDTPNLAIWTRPLPEGDTLLTSLAGAVNLGSSVVSVLDTWATNLAADTTSRPIVEKLKSAKPEQAVDSCFTADGTLVKAGDDVYDGPGPCTDPYPIKADPRIIAGSPTKGDIIACSLQDVDTALTAGIEKTEFSDAQAARLRSIFPDGVCDWTKSGRDRVDLAAPWQHF